MQRCTRIAVLTAQPSGVSPSRLWTTRFVARTCQPYWTGWVLIWILPQITVIIFTLRADIQTDKLQKEQDALEQEWGEEVKTGKRKTLS